MDAAVSSQPAGPGRENLFHVGLFGQPNVGKSTLFNRLVGQSVAIVSPHAGTTSDPVRKRVELPAVGPVVVIDTPGAGDGSMLTGAREAQIRHTAYQVDLALLLFARNAWGRTERELLNLLRGANTPVVAVHTISDADSPAESILEEVAAEVGSAPVAVSVAANRGIDEVLARIAQAHKGHGVLPNLFAGLLGAGQTVLLVTPIDAAAPQGRMILPQVQALRSALDLHALALTVQPEELGAALGALAKPPDLVVTDSQIFARVDGQIPSTVALTSFSILLARQKGDFARMAAGVEALARLRDGARILMMESCAHHATCEDIGRVKLPNWLRNRIGAHLAFDYAQGASLLPSGLEGYDLAILCGGCMVTLRQMRGTMHRLAEAGVPITNYGMAIAYLQGIFRRATAPLRGLR